jgi:diguanylate cyclase (GGDEF)-like protein
MRASLRPDAMLARYGGEEFCALVPVDRMSDAHAVAERLRQQVMNRPFGFAGFEIRSTISIGVALAHAEQPLSKTIEEADQALYQAKRSGRNRIAIFGETPMPKPATSWPTLESTLPANPVMVPV